MDEVVRALQTALRSDTRIPGAHAIRVTYTVSDGTARLNGEVDDIASKRRATALVTSYEGVARVIDDLCVRPAAAMGDGAIRDHVVAALVEDNAFMNCELRFVRSGRVIVAQDPPGPLRGSILVGALDGAVTLEGSAPSWVHKRLAGVLAWWVPGTRNVVNDLAVSPPEEDDEEEVTEAVRVALEKGPFVDAAQVAVATRGRLVDLRGSVASDPCRARRMVRRRSLRSAQRGLPGKAGWLPHPLVNSRVEFDCEGQRLTSVSPHMMRNVSEAQLGSATCSDGLADDPERKQPMHRCSRTREAAAAAIVLVAVSTIQSMAAAHAADKAAGPGNQGQAATEAPAPVTTKVALVTSAATIDKIDKGNRKLTLKDDQGHTFDVTLTPDVDIEKLRVGDQVTATYYEEVALAITKHTEGARPKVTATAVLHDGITAQQADVTARIVSVEPKKNTITIQGANGKIHTLKVEDPELQAQLSNIHPGDNMDLTYSQAVAVSIEPKDSKKR